jgi:hypothetical protein
MVVFVWYILDYCGICLSLKWVVMLQVDVEIATPEIIVSVYLLLFVPLAMAWAYFVHYGCKETHVGLWMVYGWFMDGLWIVYGWFVDCL